MNKSTTVRSSSWKNIHEDLEEEDVWNVVTETENNSIPKQSASSSSSSSSAWRYSATPKMIPKTNNYHTNHVTDVGVKQSSAPLNIPDWPKIYGTKTSGDYGYDINGDDDDGDDMVPPHEWIARKLARSQISSFSVCEGIGRTLKGRDLSKVRNSILTKTGFLE